MVLVILISNTAVKRHLTMKLEGKISLEFHANKHYDVGHKGNTQLVKMA